MECQAVPLMRCPAIADLLVLLRALVATELHHLVATELHHLVATDLHHQLATDPPHQLATDQLLLVAVDTVVPHQAVMVVSVVVQHLSFARIFLSALMAWTQ